MDSNAEMSQWPQTFERLCVSAFAHAHVCLYTHIQAISHDACNIFFFNPLVFCSQQPISSKNLIGLNRARRPHNAIFVTFVDPVVPMECLEAATTNWKRVCQKENDKRVEEQLRKVCNSMWNFAAVFLFLLKKRFKWSRKQIALPEQILNITKQNSLQT